MAQKKKPHVKEAIGEAAKRKPKQSNPTQATPMERVMIVGPTGKVRMEWRKWQ